MSWTMTGRGGWLAAAVAAFMLVAPDAAARTAEPQLDFKPLKDPVARAVKQANLASQHMDAATAALKEHLTQKPPPAPAGAPTPIKNLAKTRLSAWIAKAKKLIADADAARTEAAGAQHLIQKAMQGASPVAQKKLRSARDRMRDAWGRLRPQWEKVAAAAGLPPPGSH